MVDGMFGHDPAILFGGNLASTKQNAFLHFDSSFLLKNLRFGIKNLASSYRDSRLKNRVCLRLRPSESFETAMKDFSERRLV